MSYSSAIYSSPGQTLEDAQRAKLDCVIDLLGLAGGERVLEIGCGWGGLAGRIIERTGCHVTGLTLIYPATRLCTTRAGPARFDRQIRSPAAGLSRRRRDLRSGRVGRDAGSRRRRSYWPTFFANLRQRLNPQGAAVLQVITIDQSRFEAYRRRPEFIQRYIFPGGMLHDDGNYRTTGSEGRACGSPRSEFFGDSYARTVAEWHRRFQETWPSIEALGFDDRFKRMWEYYLAYCPVGIRNRRPERRALQDRATMLNIAI